jgi:hypothetical protein
MSILRRENKKRSLLTTLLLMLAEPHLQFGPVPPNSRQQARYLYRICGSAPIRPQLEHGVSPASIVASCGNNVLSFRSAHAPYLIY